MYTNIILFRLLALKPTDKVVFLLNTVVEISNRSPALISERYEMKTKIFTLDYMY